MNISVLLGDDKHYIRYSQSIILQYETPSTLQESIPLRSNVTVDRLKQYKMKLLLTLNAGIKVAVNLNFGIRRHLRKTA